MGPILTAPEPTRGTNDMNLNTKPNCHCRKLIPAAEHQAISLDTHNLHYTAQITDIRSVL